MKIQAQAILKALTVGDQSISLDEDEPIFLEFSAIDTGGGFKDPMLDFSVSVSTTAPQHHEVEEIVIIMADPDDSDNEVELSYEGEITIVENEINGRITEEQLPREVVRFVFGLFN